MKPPITFTIGLSLLTLAWIAPRAAVAQDPLPTGPDRSGFTLFLGLGAGFQSDKEIDESAVGIGGLNLGIGGFVSPNMAIMFRVSGTTVNYNLSDSVIDLDFTQTAGVGGITIQYWVSDRFNIEGGPGVGFWTTDFADDQGFGLILATGYSVFQSRKVSLQLGLEWAPVFTDETVQNLGFELGFQLL